MATIEINEIKRIILGKYPKQNAQKINKNFNFANQEPFSELLGNSRVSTIEIDLVKYSSDKTKCVIVKNGKEYLISENQMAVKEPGDGKTGSWHKPDRITHITVTENGYISYEINREHDDYCKGSINIHTGDKETRMMIDDYVDIYLPFSGKILNKDWWNTGFAFSPDSSIDKFIQFLGSGEGFLQREDSPVIDFRDAIIDCKRKGETGNVYRFEIASDKNNKSNWVIERNRRGSDEGYDYLNYPEFKQMLEIVKIINPISYRKFEEYISSINNENNNTLGDNLEALMADNNVKGPNKTL